MKISPDYLTDRVSVQDIAQHHDFKTCHPEFREDWERLLRKMEKGDELWRFAPPPGQIPVWGVALVRDNKIVSTLVESLG